MLSGPVQTDAVLAVFVLTPDLKCSNLSGQKLSPNVVGHS